MRGGVSEGVAVFLCPMSLSGLVSVVLDMPRPAIDELLKDYFFYFLGMKSRMKFV